MNNREYHKVLKERIGKVTEIDSVNLAANRLLSYTLVDVARRNKVQMTPTQAYIIIVQLFATIGYYLYNNPDKSLDTNYFQIKNPKDGKNLFRVFMKGAGIQSYEGQKIEEFLQRIFKPKKADIKMKELNNLFEDYICELIETSTQAEIESTQSINKLNMEQLNRDNKDEKDN